MDPNAPAGPQLIHSLVARTPESLLATLYTRCAFCRESHGGWCLAELVETSAVCPALAMVAPPEPPPRAQASGSRPS